VNFVQRTPYDDEGALDAIAENRQLRSFPHLQGHVPALKAGYTQYLAVNGDASAVIPIVLPVVAATHLRKHYGSPPQALAHIKTIRRDAAPRSCPMCGSLHSGTIDHFLDKHGHPAFAVFSPNLVPACKCNSLRGPQLIGQNAGERLLHPYFDGVLTERIVAARFTDLGPAPQVETRVVLDSQHPNYAAARFHHDNVVARTAILGYLAGRWAKLILKPGLVVHNLKRNPTDRDNLVALIEDDRDTADNSRDGKNNWDSVMLSGLLDDDVIDWLLAKLLRPGRAPNSALL